MPDALDESHQIALDGRLPSRNDYCIDQAPAFGQKGKHRLEGHRSFTPVRIDKFRIMAIRATEIAPLGENNCRDLSRVINE